MTRRASALAAIALLAVGLGSTGCTPAAEVPPADPVARPAGTPALHHVGLNSTDPTAALAWYAALWPSAQATTFGGRDALAAEMMLVFDAVTSPPAGAFDPALGRPSAQSAIWHIGAYLDTTDSDRLAEALGSPHLPLHIGPDGASPVWRSGLAPYRGTHTAAALPGVEVAEPRAGGFSYLLGPDGALVELTGGPNTRPSLSHVHLFHEQPRCAAEWYVGVLGFEPASDPVAEGEDCAAPPAEAGWPSLERIGTIRAPRAAVDVVGTQFSIYPRQCFGARCGEPTPLVGSRGQVIDHVGLRVDDLAAWDTWLRQEGVTVIEPLHDIEEGRALMIEGPDAIAIELVELDPDSLAG